MPANPLEQQMTQMDQMINQAMGESGAADDSDGSDDQPSDGRVRQDDEPVQHRVNRNQDDLHVEFADIANDIFFSRLIYRIPKATSVVAAGHH